MKNLTPVALAAALICQSALAQAPAADKADKPVTNTLEKVVINASADATKQGLSPVYAGGQVAHGGRAGILGTKDNMETPFSITAYTNELIQDRQAKSVGEVLQNDPGVRVARGFGNFQETYFIRGFILGSDDVAYNGLFSLLPRQYIATELFERVELLRGASAFLGGASPNGGGVGGNINLLPKRAGTTDLSRVSVGVSDGGQAQLALDASRRFGPDKASGVRINAAYHDGGSAVKDEKAQLSLLAVGVDWHSRDVRLSGDIGWQDNKLKRTRTSVSLDYTLTALPALPDPRSNAAQPWTYSNERDLFGTLRGEMDLSGGITAWAAYGMKRGSEANSLANLTVTDSTTGAGTTSRFDNTREDAINTGEVGLRGKFKTGGLTHEWVASASYFHSERKLAYLWDYFNTQAVNLYAPSTTPLPAFTSGAFVGNSLANPGLANRTTMQSVALGDTLSMLDDSLLLTLGLRQQKIGVDSFAYNTGTAATPYSQSRTSPLIGLVYKASKQLSLYANAIEGLTQGDTVAAANGQPEKTLAPYVSKQKEIGLKYDGGRLGFGAAVFSTDKPRAVQSQAVAQGEDRHKGLELTVFGEPARGLRLLGGVTWLNTTQHGTGVAATEGKHTLGIPHVQGNVGAEWEVAAVEGLALDARLVRTGSSYANSANTLSVPGWTRLDGGVRYLTDVQGRWLTLRLRVDNLANKKYWASAGGYPDQGYLVIGAPRTVSLSASADF